MPDYRKGKRKISCHVFSETLNKITGVNKFTSLSRIQALLRNQSRDVSCELVRTENMDPHHKAYMATYLIQSFTSIFHHTHSFEKEKLHFSDPLYHQKLINYNKM